MYCVLYVVLCNVMCVCVDFAFFVLSCFRTVLCFSVYLLRGFCFRVVFSFAFFSGRFFVGRVFGWRTRGRAEEKNRGRKRKGGELRRQSAKQQIEKEGEMVEREGRTEICRR